MSSRSGQSKDSRNILAFNDSIAEALTVINSTHRRVHTGEYFTFSVLNSIAFAAVLGVRAVFVNPIHLSVRAAYGGLAEGRLRIYQNASFSANGTQLQGKNHNRSSSLIHSTTTFASDAVFTSGTLLLDMLVPAASIGETKEWVFDGDDDPLFISYQNFNAATQNGSLNIDFYHDNAVST